MFPFVRKSKLEEAQRSADSWEFLYKETADMADTVHKELEKIKDKLLISEAKYRKLKKKRVEQKIVYKDRQVRVEVPKEVIKEVPVIEERIIEVPVEKIVKEKELVEVEKIVEVPVKMVDGKGRKIKSDLEKAFDEHLNYWSKVRPSSLRVGSLGSTLKELMVGVVTAVKEDILDIAESGMPTHTHEEVAKPVAPRKPKKDRNEEVLIEGTTKKAESRARRFTRSHTRDN